MAKGTDAFKQQIQDYLNFRGFEDPLFGKALKNEKKNIDDCITYIMTTVKSSGKAGFSDKEIFGMAVHYYDETDIVIGSGAGGKVVVNHAIELTDEEIAEAKAKAIGNVTDQEKKNLEKIIKDDLQKEMKANLTDAEKDKIKKKAIAEVHKELREAITKKPEKKRAAVQGEVDPKAKTPNTLF